MGSLSLTITKGACKPQLSGFSLHQGQAYSVSVCVCVCVCVCVLAGVGGGERGREFPSTAGRYEDSSLRSFEFLLAKVGPLQVGAFEPRPNVRAPRPAAASARPLQARTPPRAVPGRALRELRGGCSRRPGGRRREAVPQFVSNQGVRAVPRAGQQCVNKPTATPPPPRRARPAPAAAAAAAGSARLAPARRAAPPTAPPAAPPRPRRRGRPHLPPHARALAHHAPRAARPARGLPRAR